MCAQAGAPEGGYGVLEVDASLGNPFHVMLPIFQLNIDVNGQRFPGRWERNAASFPPGQYRVVVSYKHYLGDMSTAAIVVPIYSGYATILRYNAGMFFGVDASLALQGHAPLAPGG